MKINTIDIVHKTFSKSFFGLNEEEVNGFLQLIATQLEELASERNSLKETLRDKELRLAEYREKDQLLQTTITTAGKMAEKIRQDAERESRLILSEAEQRAENTVKESRDSLKKIYSDISELKKFRLQFESNLKALVQAHLAILEQSDKYLPNLGMTNVEFTQANEAQLAKDKSAVKTTDSNEVREVTAKRDSDLRRSSQVSPLSV